MPAHDKSSVRKDTPAVLDIKGFSKGFTMRLDSSRLPTNTITEMVNIRQIKHTIVNDPLVAEEYYTLAPRKPIATPPDHQRGEIENE